jgi:hypothetical protein
MAMWIIPAGRDPLGRITAVEWSEALPQDGPSCLQDPLGALGDGDHPPKQNQDEVCHPLGLTRQLVLSVNSRTSRKLAKRYAPALRGRSPQAP